MRHIVLTIISVIASVAVAMAVSPYPTLKEKAMRAFNHQEWASASAMFNLMLVARPDVANTYGLAIVANAMMADTAAQTQLMEQALNNHVAIDSVYSRVQQWSFLIGNSNIYEQFLTLNIEAHPWMKRNIYKNLLKYFTFRRDGVKMVEYSKKMLVGAENNIDFLTALADGYMLTGRFNQALNTYEKIIAESPQNIHALLCMGNYYAVNSNADNNLRSKAIEYLQRAFDIKPTPYVAATLKRLQKQPH